MSFDLSVAVDRPRVAITRKKWYVGCRAWSQLSENIYLSGVSMKSRESVSGGKSLPPLIMDLSITGFNSAIDYPMTIRTITGKST